MSNINNIKSDFVKIIDYDDVIIPWKINKLLKELNMIKNVDDLLIHSSGKVFKSDTLSLHGLQTTDKEIVKEFVISSKENYWRVPENAITIYPVKVLKKISALNLEKQFFFNDDFLTRATLMLNNGSMSFISSLFYI